MSKIQRISPCLWFDTEAEDAAKLYTSVFANSRITNISRYGEAGKQIHEKPPGSVLTVSFELDGLGFIGLNGGPQFKFTEAISLMINCDTQDEVDQYWDKLSAGGDPNAQQCGWLKDRFGLSWQVVPNALIRMLGDSDHSKSQRAFAAMMQMKKIEIAVLEKAFAG